jgi:hypothetical protein
VSALISISIALQAASECGLQGDCVNNEPGLNSANRDVSDNLHHES